MEASFANAGMGAPPAITVAQRVRGWFFLDVVGYCSAFPNSSRLPRCVFCSGYKPTGLVDKNVSSTEQRGKRSAADDDAPEYAGALFLDCGFKHDDLLLVSIDEANHGFVR
jgi:hypothetical protein